MSTFMDDCNLAVRRVVCAALGMAEDDVRPADQVAPGPRQQTSYATVKIISAPNRGTPAVTEEDDGDDLIEHVDGLVEFVASVQFFGSPPTPARLRGADVSATDLADFQAVTAGAISIPIDGTARAVTGLDFSAATDMDDVAEVLQTRLAAALTGVTCGWTNRRFLVTSPTTGQTSAVGPSTVSSVATLLGLTAAAGAVGSSNATGIAKTNQGAFDRARGLPMRLSGSSVRSFMRTIGLGYLRASEARDLSALAPGAAFESRGSIDLTFMVVDRSSLPVTPIESVPSAGLFVQAPGGEITEIPITTIEVSP